MQLSSLENNKYIDRINKLLIREKNFKAIRLLNKIIKGNPSNYDAWLLLGIAKRRVNMLSEAIKCFKTATNIDPEKEEAWGLYTITLMDNGRVEEAQQVIEKASQLNPLNDKLSFYKENLIHVYERFGPFF
jgi:tetratricopeptide (TPR) repeat protein